MSILLSHYAFREMYYCMRMAERKEKEVNKFNGKIAVDRVDLMAALNKWYISKANMYASIALTAMMAADSDDADEFQKIISDMEAVWRKEQSTLTTLPTQKISDR